MASDSPFLSYLYTHFDQLSDYRQGSNSRYSMGDIGMTAFSIYFFQSSSYLSHQRLLTEQQGKSNLHTLLGINRLPSDHVVRDQLDYVKPSEFDDCYFYFFEQLRSVGVLDRFATPLDKHAQSKHLLLLDGTWTIRSENLSCDQCLHKTISSGKDGSGKDSSGKKLYYHSVITPCLAHPALSQVISLPPEPIVPQDGSTKQDCEINAAKRWIKTHAHRYQDLDLLVLGDDLYAHQPFCEAILSKGMDFLFVCKADSHQTLYEDLALFAQNNMIQQGQFYRGAARKRQRYEVRYMNQMDIREGKGALKVNWFEVEVFDQKGKRKYQNAFITSLPISEDNIKELVFAARTRWKVENENLNTLKNQGYHIEHNFGHGKIHLANTLLTINILAFLAHTTLWFLNNLFQAIWKKVGTRKEFFQDIRTLTKYMVFESWNQMLAMMAKELRINSS